MRNTNEPPHPNQWYTPCFVRVYDDETDSRIAEEHFSDLQMAYLWAKNRVGEQLQAPNFLKSFEEMVARLTIVHTNDQSGYIFAEKDRIEYSIFYRIENLDDRSRFSVQ